jgi:phosphoenolpyruvate-protein phosphotransferase (PTS system enzyme I)
VSENEKTDSTTCLSEQKEQGEIWLQGKAVVSGIAIGRPLFLRQIEPLPEKAETVVPQKELERFRKAVAQNHADLKKLLKYLFSTGLCQEADLIEGGLFLATDPVFLDQVEEKIQTKGKKAIQAIEEVREDLQDRFKKLSTPYLQQRFEDINGVCDRLIALLAAKNFDATDFKTAQDAILCAHSVTAPLAAQVSVNGIGAIITHCGGAMSHTAIVARSRGIPYISDIDVASLKQIASDGPIVVDGMTGIVILRPKDDTLYKYMERKTTLCGTLDSRKCWSEAARGVTKDGFQIKIKANVAKETDIFQIPQYTLDGVGLYRTEYQVLEKCQVPSEEEQQKIYSQMVNASYGRPLVIRVFDFGSDKAWFPALEKIPFEIRQKRALALLLGCPDLFQTQLRALLRASRQGPLSVLFPMVTSMQELDQCLDMLHEAYRQVSAEGFLAFPKVGAMLEIPSILFFTKEIAKKVDFISLGTNDLIQYALAIDRSNCTTFDYRIAFHPGLMHLIQYVVEESVQAKIPLCICGEMASDPLLVPFLIGVGVSELSMAPRLAPGVRKVILSFTRREMQDIASKVLQAQSAQEVYIILRSFYASLNLGEV